jgi:pimeloyl-ACP methyl ester carboxylesterase
MKRAILLIQGWACPPSHVNHLSFSLPTVSFSFEQLLGSRVHDAVLDQLVEAYENELKKYIGYEWIIFGHSLGGSIGVLLAMRKVIKVFALGLMDTSLLLSEDRKQAYLKISKEGINREALRHAFFSPFDNKKRVEEILEQILAFPRELALSMMAEIPYLPIADGFKKISVPKLYIAAGEDNSIEAIYKEFPGVLTAKVIGSGHFVSIFACRQVQAILQRFLEML